MYRAEGSWSLTKSRVAKLLELSTMMISAAGCVWSAMQPRHCLRLSMRLRVMIHTETEGIDIVGSKNAFLSETVTLCQGSNSIVWEPNEISGPLDARKIGYKKPTASR